MATKTTEKVCTYYIVQHGDGHSVDNGVETDFDAIFPEITGNYEIIRFVPPSWVMMSNVRINNGIMNLLKNNVTDEDFWNMWKTQFSRNRKGKNTQTAMNSEKEIGTIAMNQMPILAETLQSFGVKQRYYNEILSHEGSPDFGIWRICNGEAEWTCIFAANTRVEVFQKNYSDLANLIYNNSNAEKPKGYSIKKLIEVLNNIQPFEGKTRFIFGSCSPLHTTDRKVRSFHTLKNGTRKPNQNNSYFDEQYWFRKLKYFYYRVKLFFEGKKTAQVNIENANNINNLEYPDLGEELIIAETDERNDMYIQFSAFFHHIETWNGRLIETWENVSRLIGDLSPKEVIKYLSPKDVLKYLLDMYKRNIYEGGISPKYEQPAYEKFTRIYNNLKKNHKRKHPGIFDELMTQMDVQSRTRSRTRSRSREKKSRSRSIGRSSSRSSSRSRGRSNRGRGRSNRGRGRRGGGRRRKISKRRKRLTRRRKRLTRRSGRP